MGATLQAHLKASDHISGVDGHDLISAFDAASVMYEVELAVQMRAKGRLDLIAEFCLRAIDRGLCAPGEIASFLGLGSDRDLCDMAIQRLRHQDLVEVDYTSSDPSTFALRLTQTGRRCIEQEAQLDMNRTETIRVSLDGLSGEVFTPVVPGMLDRLPNQTVRIPSQIGRPSTELFHQRTVLDLLRCQLSNRQTNMPDNDTPEGDLVRVESIKWHQTKYRDLSVLVYQSRTDQLGVAFRVIAEGDCRVVRYEEVLWRLEQDGKSIVPLEPRADGLLSRPLQKIVGSNALRLAERHTSDRLLYLEDELKNLSSEIHQKQRALEAMERGQEVAQKDLIGEPGSSESTESRRRNLVRELRHCEARHEEVTQDIKERRTMRLLTTFEHRPVLLQALREAKRNVIILSPWLKTDAMDLEVMEGIEKAAKRGVSVAIGYGFHEGQPCIDPHIEKQIKGMIQRLPARSLHLCRLGNTHEKVLICDDRFVVITSFNWLSFRGDENRTLRQERGVYAEDAELVREMTADAQERFLRKGVNL